MGRAVAANSHDAFVVHEEAVLVVVRGGVEPEVVALLVVPHPRSIPVGLQLHAVARVVAQELEVNLIMKVQPQRIPGGVPFRCELIA